MGLDDIGHREGDVLEGETWATEGNGFVHVRPTR